MTNKARQSRVPSSLQAVFLASNRGKDVYQPPPENVAFKVFFRNWRFQRQTNSGRRSLFGGSKDKVCATKESSKQPKEKTVVVKKDLNAKPESKSLKDMAKSPSVPSLSPQGYLDAMIRSRGYGTSRFKSLQTAYYNKPTALQQASYDVHLIDLVRRGDKEEFKAVVSAGLSPNPCNAFGESLVHMICRRGEADFLRILLDLGCVLQVADDYGRTPLHDACWAAKPCFDVVELILEVDPRMFHMTDCRGAVPLSYVRQDHWAAWLEFLESKKDVYWKHRDIKTLGEEQPPALALLGPNTRPIADPSHALTIELAGMVAAGKMQPDEAEFLQYDKNDSETYDESDSEDDSDYDSDEDDDYSLDEDEMADILQSLSIPAPSM